MTTVREAVHRNIEWISIPSCFWISWTTKPTRATYFSSQISNRHWSGNQSVIGIWHEIDCFHYSPPTTIRLLSSNILYTRILLYVVPLCVHNDFPITEICRLLSSCWAMTLCTTHVPNKNDSWLNISCNSVQTWKK